MKEKEQSDAIEAFKFDSSMLDYLFRRYRKPAA